MARLGKTAEFRNGLRVTDAETVDIARMVLVGQVNPQIVAAINVHGNYAVGVSGEDAGLIRATARDPELGFVGDVDAVNPAILDGLLDDEFIPVVATIGTDEPGQAYNINADTVAGAIAEALGAEKLVYLTDIEGLRRDVDDPASLIRQTTADELDALIADGTIAGGMIPKVESCIHAVRNGVRRAHILDGRIAHVLLLEIFTDEGIGTMSSTSTSRSATRVHTTSRCMRVGLGSTRPFMPVFGPPQPHVRARPRDRAVGHRRQALSRLPVRARRDARSATPTRSSPRRSPRRRRAAARQQLLRQPAGDGRRGHGQRAAARATGDGGQVFFTNSGAEANECAIKLARKFGGRGRHTVVSALGSFHGRTLAPLAATGQPAKHEPFQPMPEGFRHVAWGDLDAHRARRRRHRRRRADRAAAGRGRGDPGAARLPARHPRSCATRSGR